MLKQLSGIISAKTPIEDEVVPANEVSEIFKRMRFNGNKYFLSPMIHAVSSPKLIRSFHANQVESSPYKKWNRMIDDVIRAAYELSFNSYGLETAEKYQIDANDFKHKILAARGPIGFFEVGDGLCWIESEEQRNLEGQREIIDALIFVIDFEDNKKIKIATRNNRIFSLNNDNEIPTGYSGMEILDEKYSRLLKTLTEFESNWSHQASRTHHHLFCWSNTDIAEFSESFVKESVNMYLRQVEDSYMFSSTGIILAKSSDEINGNKLNNIEKIAISRARPGCSLLVRKEGENYSNVKIAQFFESIGLDMSYMMKTRSALSYHECEQTIANGTEICIVFPIWAGMWKESIDIDGEQVIFED